MESFLTCDYLVDLGQRIHYRRIPVVDVETAGIETVLVNATQILRSLYQKWIGNDLHFVHPITVLE